MLTSQFPISSSFTNKIITPRPETRQCTTSTHTHRSTSGTAACAAIPVLWRLDATTAVQYDSPRASYHTCPKIVAYGVPLATLMTTNSSPQAPESPQMPFPAQSNQLGQLNPPLLSDIEPWSQQYTRRFVCECRARSAGVRGSIAKRWRCRYMLRRVIACLPFRNRQTRPTLASDVARLECRRTRQFNYFTRDHLFSFQCRW